jgi:DNA-binding transcriptional LysR family regulator
LELRQLRYFVEVASCGSISRASENLSISQSAVSRQISDLEQELAVLLLNRSPGGVSLTPSGERLLGYAGDILNTIEQVKLFVSADKEQEHIARFGIPPSLSHLFLDAFSLRLSDGQTPVRVQIVEASTYWLQQRLDFGDLDCAILTNGRPTRMLNVWPLWREDLFLLSPQDSAFSGHKECELHEVVQLPLILTPPQDATRRTIDAAFAAHNLVPHIRHELEAMSVLSAHLETGKAYTILSRSVAKRFHQRLGLCITPISGLSVERSFAVRRGSLTLRVEDKIVSATQFVAREEFQDDRWMVFDGE